MKKKGRKIMRIFIFAAIFLPFFISCSQNGSQKSFISALDEIDMLINQHQYKEAVSKLNKVEKRAYSSWSHIGVFRRYKLLNENKSAESVLVNALKKNPENLELSAVYANFLMRMGNNEKALSIGKCLRGTKYGSIYSESVLKDTLEHVSKEELRKNFNSADYYFVYYDAYIGSKNNAWLRNCSLLYLSKGDYVTASSIHPDEVSEFQDSFFWALVMYDAERFGDSINYAEAAKSFISNDFDKINKQNEILSILNLEVDSYSMLKDENSAEKIRQDFISSLVYEKDEWILPSDYYDEDIALIFVNSAHWAFDNQNDDLCAKYLFYVVNKWPNNIYGLSLYADFAYQSSLSRKEDYIQLELRDSGTTSLEMERFDNRTKIPVTDAIYRINKALENTHDPMLYVISLDLKYKTMLDLSIKEKLSDLWNILEKNTISPGIYSDILFDYSVSFLLNNKNIEDAWNLFLSNISKKYNILGTENFWNDLYEKKTELTQKEIEYASYFATIFLRANDSLRFYEFACLENNNIISSFVSDDSCINLAMVYNSLGRTNDAIEIYSKVVGRCTNLKLKSLIMYRIALIYFNNNDNKMARKNAEYALTLDSYNAPARLLINKIKLK